jgi:hypothetical protein
LTGNGKGNILALQNISLFLGSEVSCFSDISTRIWKSSGREAGLSKYHDKSHLIPKQNPS